MSTPATIPAILGLYQRWGLDHYDEELSQLDHARQTAALAVEAGAGEALVAAALLHDVGHLLVLDAAGASPVDPGAADLHHEAIGAAYLTAVFPPTVTGPIALHVRAKRYRCAVDPGAIEALSAGSQRSLIRQGGPLDADEVTAFEQNPGFAGAMQLRAWDDCGKVEHLVVAPLTEYLDLLARVARG